MDFVTEAKKAYWAAGCRKTQGFRDKVRALLLEKLSLSGEPLEQDDLDWVDARVEEMFQTTRTKT